MGVYKYQSRALLTETPWEKPSQFNNVFIVFVNQANSCEPGRLFVIPFASQVFTRRDFCESILAFLRLCNSMRAAEV